MCVQSLQPLPKRSCTHTIQMIHRRLTSSFLFRSPGIKQKGPPPPPRFLFVNPSNSHLAWPIKRSTQQREANNFRRSSGQHLADEVTKKNWNDMITFSAVVTTSVLFLYFVASFCYRSEKSAAWTDVDGFHHFIALPTEEYPPITNTAGYPTPPTSISACGILFAISIIRACPFFYSGLP